MEWIVPEGNNVTQDFIDYALPLIQGVPEIPLENGLPRYARLKRCLQNKRNAESAENRRLCLFVLFKRGKI